MLPFVLIACVRAPSSPAPIEIRPPAAVPAPPGSVDELMTAPPPQAMAEANPAAALLLEAARRELLAGRVASATANVERALNIDPGDARVWHALAEVRLAERRYDQARSSAERSNALPSADDALLAANWALIARVEQARGDDAAMREALAASRRYGSRRDAAGVTEDGGGRPLSE